MTDTTTKLIAISFILILAVSGVQAAFVFNTDAVTRIIVSKILSVSPQGQALLTAYQWATDPLGAIIGELPQGTSQAIQVAMGANPITVLSGMAMQAAQQKVLEGIYNQLSPEGKIAFSNAQEYSSYMKQALRIEPNSEDAKNLAMQSSYDEKTGITTFKTPDGKGGYNEFLQIPKGWGTKAKDNQFVLTASEVDQEFRFKDKVSAYLQKGGKITVQGTEIVEADFVTAKESRIALGENSQITVPANATVKYRDGIIEIQGKSINFKNENVDFTNSIKISKNKLIGSFRIKGIEVRNGILSVENNGCLLYKGIGEKDRFQLTIDNEKDAVLIANDDAGMSKYAGNWVKSGKDKFESQSIKGSGVNLEVLPGNELFSTFIRDYKKTAEGSFAEDPKTKKLAYENAPDENIYFKVKILNGDGLDAASRKKEGKIPELTHKSSAAGITKIENGRLEFWFGNNPPSIQMAIPKKLDLSPEAKQDSVAFQIGSDALKSEVRITSSNLFGVMAPDGKERVAFTKEGLKLSDLIKDNEVLTLGQLQEKYRGIDFGIPKIINPLEGGAARENKITRVSPQIIQIVDQWISENPDVVGRYSSIQFTDEKNAASSGAISAELASKNHLILGEEEFDVYGERTRDNTPFTVLFHEDEHTKDRIVAINELGEIDKKMSATAKEYAEIIKGLEEEDKKILEMVKKNGGQSLSEQDKERYFDLPNEIRTAKEIFEKELSKDPETKKLQQFYNERVWKASINLLENEKDSLNGIREKAADSLIKIAKQKFGLDIKREDVLKNEDTMVDEFWRTFANKFGENPVGKNNWPEEVQTLELAFFHLAHLSQSNINKDEKNDPTGAVAMLSVFSNEFNKLGLKDLASELEKLPEKFGLPAAYALNSYAREYEVNEAKNQYSAEFKDLSPTYKEEPIELRKQRITSSNQYDVEMYKDLTQLAFDAGKMPAKDYIYLMGNICKKPDCCDQKCKLYKLSCVGACA
jgi:hypothetical protein